MNFLLKNHEYHRTLSFFVSKTNILLFTFLISISFDIIAQNTVSAEIILNDIKNGKSVSYENVTINGVFDMTYMDDKLPELPRKRKWYKGDNSIEQQIEGKISFINCVFEDDVFAYIHDEDTKYTFIANFENDVAFTNCIFNGEALFKYSDFDRKADFSKSEFKDRSTFKYVEFKTYVSFANTTFEEDAIFKYTEFKKGVSFNSTNFRDDLDIKYVDVNGDFDADNMKVNNKIYAKYADINGKSFTKYLLNSKN